MPKKEEKEKVVTFVEDDEGDYYPDPAPPDQIDIDDDDDLNDSSETADDSGEFSLPVDAGTDPERRVAIENAYQSWRQSHRHRRTA